MKFYQTKSFKALQTEWRSILKGKGFEDHEDDRERLKQPDRRTIAFENREITSEFFSELGLFLSSHRIPRKHRQVLERYSKGMFATKIMEQTGFGRTTVYSIIRKYKNILINGE